MKKKFRIITRITLAALILWVILAQSCMRFRISDDEAIADFSKGGVMLQSRTATINKHHLHYVFSGMDTLPVLVFVHGSPGSWSAFENYLRDSELLTRYHMVSIDRPGFGYSDYGSAQPMDVQVQLISLLLRQLKTDKPMYLVGHSLGGPIIAELAYSNPDLIDGLVILAGSVDPKEETTERWRPVLSYSPLRYFIPGAMRPSNDELMYFKTDVFQMPHTLLNIKCHVYILHGDHDSMVPYENALYAKKNLVNAKSVELITLAGKDHFIPWTNYNDIKNVLLRLNK
jgi:pimeloyl-ACP methyl ester carboxylesterase